MSETPRELKYIDTHEWVREEGDGVVSIGITDHAQDALGDLVYVEMPEVGIAIKAGDEVGVVESVKAASDIFTPLSGTVVAINEELNDAPELVNKDPYGDGWMFRIKLSDPAELTDLLSAEDYRAVCEAHE